MTTPTILESKKKEYYVAFSATMVDLCNKDKPTLKDIGDILERQFNWIIKNFQPKDEK